VLPVLALDISDDKFSEWQTIDIALQSYQKVAVGLYDTLGKDSVGTYWAPQIEMRLIFSLAEYMYCRVCMTLWHPPLTFRL